MTKYITFAQDGTLNGRYDSEINWTIPAGAVKVSDELYFRTINEQDGAWKYIGGVVTKTALPGASPEQRKAIAYARINAAYENAVGQLIAGYPTREIESWAKQEIEARAWLKDSNAPTPWIDSAATARGIPKPDFVAKIIEQADQLAPLHGALSGKRQYLRDRIDALPNPTQEQLDAIEW